MMRSLGLAMALAIAGCGGGTNGAKDLAMKVDLGGGGVDSSTEEDLAMEGADLATEGDLAVAPDLASGGGQCKADGDCRLFSSYCATAPCVCVPLGVNEKDPPCGGKMVTCFEDPCDRKVAVCVAGVCQAQ